MTQTYQTSVVLPVPVLQAAEGIIHDEGISLSQLIEEALNAELQRRLDQKLTRPPRKPLSDTERANIITDLNSANSWEQLTEWLLARGYRLRPAGPATSLYGLSDRQRLCTIADLGVSYAALSQRIGPPPPAPQIVPARPIPETNRASRAELL
ncbi:MAG: hypothetical protein ACPGNV_04145 [Mangrovicoccus sp.]